MNAAIQEQHLPEYLTEAQLEEIESGQSKAEAETEASAPASRQPTHDLLESAIVAYDDPKTLPDKEDDLATRLSRIGFLVRGVAEVLALQHPKAESFEENFIPCNVLISSDRIGTLKQRALNAKFGGRMVVFVFPSNDDRLWSPPSPKEGEDEAQYAVKLAVQAPDGKETIELGTFVSFADAHYVMEPYLFQQFVMLAPPEGSALPGLGD